MLKEERYEKILEIIENENYITATELSKRLYVSLPTIRRDLTELSSRNQLHRSHGGAKKISPEHVSTPLDFRKSLNFGIKRKLCEKAAELIKDNDVIFIDASSTALQLSEFISQKKDVTVVTNSIPLSMILKKKGIKTYCTGGEIQENSFACSGCFAEDFADSFNFDIVFFSCYCVTDGGIIADTSLPETSLRKSVLKNSKLSVFLCDSTKFGKTAPHNLMPVSTPDVVITDLDKTSCAKFGISENKLI